MSKYDNITKELSNILGQEVYYVGQKDEYVTFFTEDQESEFTLQEAQAFIELTCDFTDVNS